MPCAYCGPSPPADTSNSSATFGLGEVYPTATSIYAPIWQLLRGPLADATTAAPGDQLAKMRRIIDRHKARRPCVLMGRPTRQAVCVMTTYDGKPLADLPPVFAYFSIAVASMDAQSAAPALPVDIGGRVHLGHGTHTHTMPPWPRGPQWIIGIVLQLDAPIVEGADRWHCTRETGEQEYAFGEHAMGILIAHCRTREVSWQEDVVTNRDAYAEYELQIKVRTRGDHSV